MRRSSPHDVCLVSSPVSSVQCTLNSPHHSTSLHSPSVQALGSMRESTRTSTGQDRVRSRGDRVGSQGQNDRIDQKNSRSGQGRKSPCVMSVAIISQVQSRETTVTLRLVRLVTQYRTYRVLCTTSTADRVGTDYRVHMQ